MSQNNLLQLENILFTVALVAYVLSMVGYFITYATKSEKLERISKLLVIAGFVLQTGAIVARGIGAGRPPLSNQYEFATSFAWAIALFFLLFNRKYPYQAMGTFILPIVVLMIGYAATTNKEVRPLMPALQSGWLVVHVFLAIMAYGSFSVAGGVGAMYLVKDSGRGANLPPTDKLDNISYRAVVIGFLCISLTIITGALWAHKAWGRFWAWDPKETWSLITFIIYTAYLHMRRSRNMRGRKAAWFAVIGLIAVLFTYIGVNTLLPSLHSYA